MGSIRRNLILSGAKFLLGRAWGRKVVWEVTEHVAEEGAREAMDPAAWEHLLHGAVEAAMTPVYFLVGFLSRLYGHPGAVHREALSGPSQPPSPREHAA
jgi:hypothetical protein